MVSSPHLPGFADAKRSAKKRQEESAGGSGGGDDQQKKKEKQKQTPSTSSGGGEAMDLDEPSPAPAKAGAGAGAAGGGASDNANASSTKEPDFFTPPQTQQQLQAAAPLGGSASGAGVANATATAARQISATLNQEAFIADLEARYLAVRDERDGLRKSASDQRGEVDALRRTVEELRSTLAERGEELAGAKRRGDEARQKREGSDEEKRNAEERVARMGVEADALREEIRCVRLIDYMYDWAHNVLIAYWLMVVCGSCLLDCKMLLHFMYHHNTTYLMLLCDITSCSPLHYTSTTQQPPHRVQDGPDRPADRDPDGIQAIGIVGHPPQAGTGAGQDRAGVHYHPFRLARQRTDRPERRLGQAEGEVRQGRGQGAVRPGERPVRARRGPG